MTNTSVIGLQWGDEGKGKVAHLLSHSHDIGFRWHGGNNAGHTVVTSEGKYKFSLIPSCIIREDCIGVIGPGVVLDLRYLIEEIAILRKQGVEVSSQNLKIDHRCHLVLPSHISLDSARDKQKGGIGTTIRGIGPCYEDKIGRRGLRLCDFEDAELVHCKISDLVKYHSHLLKLYDISYNPDIKSLLRDLIEQYHIIKDYICDSMEYIRLSDNILFEGAQGVNLDIDLGSYPYVTSSSVISVPSVKQVNRRIGVFKSYSTRVGNGPFPTEIKSPIGCKLVNTGEEFGTVTGRQRRCGWLDLELLRRSIMYTGVNELIITKIDVLDNFEEILICTGYHSNSTPQFDKMPGWKSTTYGVTRYCALPCEAQKYINYIEEQLNIPISMISTGEMEEQVIIL